MANIIHSSSNSIIGMQWHSKMLLVAVLLFLVLSFGFGFFFGRMEQIELNKALLKPIADVNCR